MKQFKSLNAPQGKVFEVLIVKLAKFGLVPKQSIFSNLVPNEREGQDKYFGKRTMQKCTHELPEFFFFFF